jgi:peroxiredoxin
MTMTDNLTAQYEALHAERERTWDPAKLRDNIEQRRALVEAFDPATVIKAGDEVAPFTLELSTGGSVSLEDLTSDGPVALVFFRFAGCPACNLALPYYDRTVAPALREAGIRLVAVSPHLVERGIDAIRTRHDLGFEVASDRGNQLARRFGIAFHPLKNSIPVGDDNWIGALTGTGSWELPQPAVVLIDRDHVVKYVDISPDWLRRTEADAILGAVQQLASRRHIEEVLAS